MSLAKRIMEEYPANSKKRKELEAFLRRPSQKIEKKKNEQLKLKI